MFSSEPQCQAVDVFRFAPLRVAPAPVCHRNEQASANSRKRQLIAKLIAEYGRAKGTPRCPRCSSSEPANSEEFPPRKISEVSDEESDIPTQRSATKLSSDLTIETVRPLQIMDRQRLRYTGSTAALSGPQTTRSRKSTPCKETEHTWRIGSACCPFPRKICISTVYSTDTAER